MANSSHSIVVVGIGKSQAGDDAVGLTIVDGLRKCPDLGCEVRACEGGCPPGFLAEIPADTMIIFFDAVQAGRDPGTICCVKLPSKTIQSRHLEAMSTHGFGLEREMELARNLNGALPRMFLVGIQVENCDPASELSAKVKAAAEEIIREFPRYKKLAADLT